jgi:Predicted membrane protein
MAQFQRSSGRHRIRKMVYAAVIAALYVTLGIVFAPISFGPVQLRISEAMAILPVFNPAAIWGLALGCAITNFIGMSTGANLLGAVDIYVGTAATIIAAVLTWLLRNRKEKTLPVLATLPPVFVNALFIGAELCFAFSGSIKWTRGWYIEFFGFVASVAGGQLVACTVLGLLLYISLEKTKAGNALREL